MSTRPLHTTASPAATDAMAAFHAQTILEVASAIATHDIVVVGMGWNPHVGNVRKALDEAGFAHHYLGYGNYLQGWKPRLSIKMWTGWPTFPQVFVRGTLIGGNKDTRRAIQEGSLQALLNAAR